MYNDTWNAEEFYSRYGQDIMYSSGEWYYWDGKSWSLDTMNHIPDLAVTMMKELLAVAEGKEAKRHYTQSGNNAKIEAMLKLLAKRKELNVSPDELDPHNDILTLKNGLFSLKSFQLYEPDKSLRRTRSFGVEYNPEATCPIWEAFLSRIFVNHPELVEYMQRISGYGLSSSMREQCLFIFYGDGMNGKSTLVNVLHKLFGNFAYAVPAGTFIAKKYDSGVPSDIAGMYKKRFCTCLETGKSKHLNEPLIKQITGGDMITARFMYKDFFTFYPTAKIFLATNHKPTIASNDRGIWRRLKLIPLDTAITIEEVDEFRRIHGVDIEHKLFEEIPGIFNWMLEGYKKWQEIGLQDPIVVTTALDDYRDQQDAIGQFIAECCEKGPLCHVKVSDFYKAFKIWSKEQGYPFYSQAEILDYMKSKGMESQRNWNRTDERGKRFFEGIKITENQFDKVDDNELPF